VLNLLGEVTEMWTDKNGDNSFNNNAVDGVRDSVTLMKRDIVNESNRIVQRSRQWVRDEANNDILVATSFTATNGTWSKSVPLTGAVSVTTSSKELNGNSASTTLTYLTTTEALETLQTRTLNEDG
jgi:capsid protein